MQSLRPSPPPSSIEFDALSPFLSVFATSYDSLPTTPSSSIAFDSDLASESKAAVTEDSSDTAEELPSSLGSEPDTSASKGSTIDTSKLTNTGTSTYTGPLTDATANKANVDTAKGKEATMDQQETDAASTVVDTAPTDSDDARSAGGDSDGDNSTASYTDYYVGTSTIADPLKYIAMSFEDKHRELEGLKRMRERELAEAATAAALLDAIREEKEQLQDSLSESESARAALEEQVQQLLAEVASLKADVGHKDQLLATSDKISTSLFGVLMAAKSTLDSAETLAPAMRSITSSYAASSSSTDLGDSDSDDDEEGADSDDDAHTADTDHEGANGLTNNAADATLTEEVKRAAAGLSPMPAAGPNAVV